MDRMNWEGLKRQKKVSQLTFETIPQICLQLFLWFGLISGLGSTDITFTDETIEEEKEELVGTQKGSLFRAIFKPSIFSQCVTLGFDTNLSDLSTGNTLVFELIFENDYDVLWYLLNEHNNNSNNNPI